jgi:hypothetical protein
MGRVVGLPEAQEATNKGKVAAQRGTGGKTRGPINKHQVLADAWADILVCEGILFCLWSAICLAWVGGGFFFFLFLVLFCRRFSRVEAFRCREVLGMFHFYQNYFS